MSTDEHPASSGQSGEVVATYRKARCLLLSLDARLLAAAICHSACFCQRSQDCQRQRFVAVVRGIVKLYGEVRLPRERAKPLIVLMDEATHAPLRQLEFDQSKRGIHPGARFDQSADSNDLIGPGEVLTANATVCDRLCDKRRSGSRSSGEPLNAFVAI